MNMTSKPADNVDAHVYWDSALCVCCHSGVVCVCVNDDNYIVELDMVCVC